MSASSAAPRPPEDLTAAARIRDAALDQFAEHGYAGATMRGIADAAGVSVGLVQHHYGTKRELREACDEYVFSVVGQGKLDATADGSIADRQFLSGLMAAAPRLLRYLARGLTEGTPSATALWNDLVDAAEAFLTQTWPDRYPAGAQRTGDAAAAMGAMHAGAIVLHALVAERLGLEPWEDLASPRLSLAMFDLYAAMGEYVTTGVGARMRDTVVEISAGAPPRPAPGE